MANNLYECAIRSPSIAAAGFFNIIFTTGNSHCVFLDRLVGFSGLETVANVYRSPTVTEGTGTVGEFFAIDTSTGVVTISNFLVNPTVTSVGTKVGATSYYKGSTTVGNGVIGTYGTQRGKRRLAPFTTYLLQFQNNDISAQVIDVYFRWYEGPQESPGGI
ncbi:MAG TPA: hypothetical protein VJM50_21415 [Pyrinomonadaceae bacterium]|nr:hypothetical protein [Pyrinomonadaceae bacterium]